MSQPTDDPNSPAPLEYFTPTDAARQRQRVGYGMAVGGVNAVLVLGAAILVGRYIAKGSGADEIGYAEVAGAAAGAVTGLGLLLALGIVLIQQGRLRRSPMLRGAGIGALLTLGLAGLGVGICAAVV